MLVTTWARVRDTLKKRDSDSWLGIIVDDDHRPIMGKPENEQ